MTVKKISVVVCTLNEEKRLEDCLKNILSNPHDELIVVDGGSQDRTVEIARRYGARVIESPNSNLTRDRQVGIDSASYAYIAMIDADHRLEPNDLQSLLNDLEKYDLDIVQTQLISYENHSFWNASEEQAWFLIHNIPGQRKMIGVAPAMFKRRVFQRVKFDDHITSTIDDTDFMYRLSKFPDVKIGIGDTRVKQLHFATLKTYVRKFKWYGRGDGEFCRKHPNRALSILFHLLIRYPILYSWRAVRSRKFKAVPYFVLQGYVRFYGLMGYLLLGRLVKA